MYTAEQRAYIDRMKELSLKCIKGPGLTRKFMNNSDIDPAEMLERMISTIVFVDSVVCAIKYKDGLTDNELGQMFIDTINKLGACDMMTGVHFFLRGAIACLTNQYALYDKEKLN